MNKVIKGVGIGCGGLFLFIVLTLAGIYLFIPKEELERQEKEAKAEAKAAAAKELYVKDSTEKVVKLRNIKIESARKSWCDSLIKAAKGRVYESYTSNFKDTAYLYLTIEPSKKISEFKKSELPFLKVGYDAFMSKKFGDKYTGDFILAVLQGKEYRKLEAKYAKINTMLTNGRFVALEILIKDGINDPDSFEHVRTEMEDKGKYLLVRVTARVRNVYGALVLTSFDAKLGFDGSLISLKEN